MLNSKKSNRSKFQQFIRIFANKQVIIAIFVTLALLIFFRIGSLIPMPYVQVNVANQQNNTFLDMMNLLGGGGLTQISIFSIGISPYITAQIIMQLLSSDLIPPLARLSKSGERGRKKIEVFTRLLTLPIAVIQSYAILSMIISNGDQIISFSSAMTFEKGSSMFYFFYIALMVAGTYISIFLGDLITKRGVGNGMTLIILAGILSTFFYSFQVVYDNLANVPGANAQLIQIVAFIVYFILYLILLMIVVFINGSIRKIPIQQVGQTLSKNPDELSFLPIKINTVGVIPVIFASSIMTIPSTVAQFLPKDSSGVQIIDEYFSLNGILGIFIYFVLIILFNFFYSYVQLNPNRISTDFQKSGRFIPGIKMGNDTEVHISRVLYRINWIGGPFLAAIAALPYIISIIALKASGGAIMIPSTAALGGTGIVIIVTSTVEIWSSIKSTSTTTNYQFKRKEIEKQLHENDNSRLESELW